MKCSPKLRQYHDQRRDLTNRKLIDALTRMANGTAVKARPGQWTKLDWANEAEVNVNTVVMKDDAGEFVFAEANKRFDVLAKRTTSHLAQLIKERQLLLHERDVFLRQIQRHHDAQDDQLMK